MTILWRRARRWVSKYSKQSISTRRICVYRRILLPTFHECHDLLTQVSLKVFEIIRRPSCGRPVTIHEAVTAVRPEDKTGKKSSSWWPTKMTRRDKQSGDVTRYVPSHTCIYRTDLYLYRVSRTDRMCFFFFKKAYCRILRKFRE